MAKRFRTQRPSHLSEELPRISPVGDAPAADPSPTEGPVLQDAPRPIGVDPEVTGAFGKISAGDGAVIPKHGSGRAGGARDRMTGVRDYGTRGGRIRQRTQPAPKMSIVVIALVAGCFVLAAFLLFWHAFAAPAPSTGTEEGGRIEQTESSPNQPLYYDSYAYTAQQQQDGVWAFVRSAPTGSDPLVLFTFDGTPVEVVLYDGVFVIPQNLNGTWDILVWVMGDGSVANKLMGEDGIPVSGQGELAGAALDGSTLSLTTQDGTVQSIPLDFNGGQ